MGNTAADLIVIGHGTGDALQITRQAQTLLQQHGFAFAIGAPSRLTRLLTSSGVDLEHLDERMLAEADPHEALLVAADAILKQTEVERPVIVLVPGNPMLLNSLSRFLVAEAAGRDLVVQRVAGISPLDIIVNELGIDVAGRGLQVFAAGQVANGRSQPSPDIPTVMLRAGDLLGGDGRTLASLRDVLLEIYPTDQTMTLFNIELGGTGTSFATAPVRELSGFEAHIDAGSSFYVGPVRR